MASLLFASSAWSIEEPEIRAALSSAKWNNPIRLNIEVANHLGYKPHHIALMKGLPYVLTFINSDPLAHDFTSSSFLSGIAVKELRTRTSSSERQQMTHIKVKPRQFTELWFVPLVSGEFPFFCSISGHREAGMEGVITVE